MSTPRKELKVKLKRWEREFEQLHQRLPVKKDIDQDENIKSLYLQYKELTKPSLSQMTAKLKSSKEVEVIPATPVIKKRKLFEESPKLHLFKKVKESPKKLEAEFNFEDTLDVELEVPKDEPTPQKKVFNFELKQKVPEFRSPAARPTLRLSQKLQTKPSLVTVLESPAAKQQDQYISTIDDAVLAQLDLGQLEQAPPTFDDDVPFEQEVVHLTKQWKKKPIMGKRQTSKRKLEPVYKSKEVTETKSKRTSRGPQKMKGMKQSVDFSKADGVKSKFSYKK